ncbi:LuxR C-terminal-related transcriptional regulator [Serratia fonticola]|uniref:LuxR C-terminal-related transcriptional regulator n=1 Tax=Serratia fonticola TaxID=47917 RepID=UPI000961E841|nr:LuxR C-terminal-related transcriptional regulator [Serratia fonticola]OKP21410.1 hypothetical protein BSQ40_25885 [Serratia fonticola]
MNYDTMTSKKNLTDDLSQYVIKILSPCMMSYLGIEKALCDAGAKSENISGGKSVKKSNGFVDIYIGTLVGCESIFTQLSLLCNFSKSGSKVIVYIPTRDLMLFKIIMSFGIHGIICEDEPLNCIKEKIIELVNKEYISLLNIKEKSSIQSMLRLSDCERNVLLFLLSGESVTSTAKKLGRNIKTVSAQKRQAMFILGMKNDADLYSAGATLKNLIKYKI